MKEGIDVSCINRHETRVDDVVIKVGLIHGEWFNKYKIERKHSESFSKLLTEDEKVKQHSMGKIVKIIF